MNVAPLRGVSRVRRMTDFGGYLLEHGEREPEQENELEGEVEGEPVYDAHEALNDTGKGVSRVMWRSGYGRDTNVKKEKTTQY